MLSILKMFVGSTILLLFIFINNVTAKTISIASYEPSETALMVTSGEIQSIQKLLGGVGEVPFATDGMYVLELSWTNQTDHKVEIYHGGLNYDLADYEKILVDIYIPSGSTLFDSNGLIGFWSNNWIPNNWAGGNIVPTENDQWFTIEMNISSSNSSNLSYISALVFENYAADNGTIYIDNIRLVNNIPGNITATGHDRRIDIDFSDIESYNVIGYDIYRSAYSAGPYTKINALTYTFSFYSDYIGSNNETYYYFVRTITSSGSSVNSDIVSASTYEMTDTEFLDSVQKAIFRYHWDYAHPVSGLSYDGLWGNNPSWSCSISATGFGIMNIVVAAEKDYIDRADAAKHILKMLTFLDEKTTRYHGAWAHFVNGQTGETVPFSQYDDGADIVETAFVVEGMLIAHQYFNGSDPVETAIRQKATTLWEGVEWNWFRRYPDGDSIYWHWSPNYGWQMDMPIRGYNEVMMVHLLAIASPTYPMPASSYHNGWAKDTWYTNDNTYYGYRQWVGSYGLCLFFTHYSQVAFDPRNKTDRYCNYFENSRNIALIHRAYCDDNPKGFVGHSNLIWGFTASSNPWGYAAPYIPNDNGTIPPTAAISSMPYTPVESTAMMRHIYNTYGSQIWGPLGFYDAFNLTEGWFANGYIGIDQGPITPMIENYLTGLCWDLFMANPEIKPMMDAIGFHEGLVPSADINNSVSQGLEYEYYTGVWSSMPEFDLYTPAMTGEVSNFSTSPSYLNYNFAFRYNGYIDIPVDGTYYFYLNSDDGSQLLIGDFLIVDNDGLHSAGNEIRGAIGLEAGLIPITVLYFQNAGDTSLTVKYEGPTISRQTIPNSMLYHCNLVTDLTNDCYIDNNDLRILAEKWLNYYDFSSFANMATDWLK